MNSNSDNRNDATTITKRANMLVKEELPFDDQTSFEMAEQGQIQEIPDTPVYLKSDPTVTVWDPARYNFVQGDAPDTVNPSLWRQSTLTNIGGLFEVVPGIYQVRNYDIANLTIIESEYGIIIVDVLSSAETAKASLDLYYKWRQNAKPVIAVIITHSHLDHFAGIIDGVTTMTDIECGIVRVIAPDGLVNHACMENIYMSNVLGRRSSYMYGNLLPADAKGDVGAGLGTILPFGTVTLIPERCIESITDNFKTIVIDNLTFEFQLTPDTEAPAEMHFYIREYQAICPAENANHTMHNIYSLRGAQVRDALSWSKDLNTALQRWGSGATVLFGVHHWPVWGNADVIQYLKYQRDLYRYIHDQTIRLTNMGYKPVEIAETLRRLPPNLETDWDLRGYYGTLNHNVKSVVVKHIGWFDGNPATLHPYPPHEAGKKYVELIGAENLLTQAQLSYDQGDYRWVVEVVNHLIFAYPDPKYTDYYDRAKALQANALEQLGYQAESGPWRNFYLSGAQELRDGVNVNARRSQVDQSFMLAMPSDFFYDYMAMLLKGWEVRDTVSNIRIIFNDIAESYDLELENGALNHNLTNPELPVTPDCTIDVNNYVDMYNLVSGIAVGVVSNPELALQQMKAAGRINWVGDIDKFIYILNNLQTWDPYFNVVEPVVPESNPQG